MRPATLRFVSALSVAAFAMVCVAAAGTPRFAYVPNIDDGTVSQFYVNATTGQLFPNGYVMAGDHPRSFVAVGNHAYVANMNSGDISAYSLSQTTGKLTPLTSPTYSAPGNPFAMIAHPNGKFLYVVDSLGGHVYVYSIAANGSLSLIASPSAGTQPRFVAIAGSGSFLYVANFGSNNVSAYRVNATTGLLTTIGTYATGGVHPSNVMTSGSFLYVTNAKSNNVSAFVINATTGALTHVSGSPFAAGTSPYGLTREFFGHFIYVGNSLSNNISVFKVNQTTGALTKVTGSPFPATKGTQAVRVSPANNYLYAADAGAEEVMVYAMNLTTGALTNTSSVRTHGVGFDMYVSNGTALTIAPSVAYVMNNDNNIPFNVFPLATYRINGTSGALTGITSSIDTADVDSIGHDPTGRSLLEESSGFHDSPYFRLCRAQSDGSCVAQAGGNADLFGIAFDWQGVYGYYGFTDPDLGWQGISGFKLSSSGSTPTPGSPYAFPGEPMGFDLSGKFLYTNNNNSLELLKVDPATGDLSWLNDFSALNYSTAVHPSGRFLYAGTSGGVLAEAISPTDGSLTTLSFSATSGGNLLIEQTGNFAYISDGSHIFLYRINKTTGALTRLSTVLTTHANAQIDASGNFLYLVLNGVMGSTPTVISSYKINHSTGAITFGASKSFATNSSTGYSLTTIQKVQ